MNSRVETSVRTVPPPALPRTLAETGLGHGLMRDILLKTMFRKSVETIADIAAALRLPIGLSQELIDAGRRAGLIEATGNVKGGGEMGFRLTETGSARTLDALAQSEYYGPMPVPLSAYKLQVARQSVRDIRITREGLSAAMGDLVLPEGLLDQLGPAVGSGRSVLMYGPPGNGKSSIAEGIRAALGDNIWIPHALEYAGQVITLFDPIVHVPVKRPADEPLPALRRTTSRIDSRYVRCRRPTVMTGGELSLDMLDLAYNPVARTYQASLQLKSTGGVFIVDDLGRQAEPPQKIINRWIVPMEMGYDILALQSGEKFEVPFDTLVVFSTNFHPNDIFDVAALRRIFYKVLIDGPSQSDFLKIFALVARSRNLVLDEESILHLLRRRYPEIDYTFASYHAPFLVDQIVAICEFEGVERRMTPKLVDRAWENLFVADASFAH
jgi:hypothetical protein